MSPDPLIIISLPQFIVGHMRVLVGELGSIQGSLNRGVKIILLGRHTVSRYAKLLTFTMRMLASTLRF